MRKISHQLVKFMLVIAILCAGCATRTTHVVELHDGARITDQSHIAVLKADEPIEQQHRLLGRVYTFLMPAWRWQCHHTKEDALIETLKIQAAELGADAITQTRYSRFAELYGNAGESSCHAWASGMAIEFLQAESQIDSANDPIPFGVTIMPAINKEAEKPVISEYNSFVQKLAQYYLENRGYYTELEATGDVALLSAIGQETEDAALSGDLARSSRNSTLLWDRPGAIGDTALVGNLAQASPREIAALGSENTRYVLIITIEAKAKIELLISKSEGVGGKALLIDKTTGEVIWGNRWSGGQAAGGILRMMMDEYEVALKKGLIGSLKTLPLYKGKIDK
jgi:hypothetical protein